MAATTYLRQCDTLSFGRHVNYSNLSDAIHYVNISHVTLVVRQSKVWCRERSSLNCLRFPLSEQLKYQFRKVISANIITVPTLDTQPRNL
jgi:hypothetical protein